jgi:AraC-like DNA-binding protein
MLTVREARKEKCQLIIDRLWCVTDPTADGEETILPSGRVQIIFSLSGLPLNEHDPNDPQLDAHALQILQGPSTQPRRVSLNSQTSLCGVSFKPGGAGALFGPIMDITDRVIDLTRIWRGDAARLRGELQALETHEARIDLLEREIEKRIADTSEAAMVTRGLDRMREGHAIKDVCAELALSPHLFRKLFLRNVGLTPKHYLRIERFRAALNLLSPDSSLSDVAFDAQFADQPHMTREIEQFASTTPGRLKTSRRPYAGHVRDKDR